MTVKDLIQSLSSGLSEKGTEAIKEELTGLISKNKYLPKAKLEANHGGFQILSENCFKPIVYSFYQPNY